MRNNINESKSIFKTFHVVYKISSLSEDCVLPNSNYLGQSQNTLSVRLMGYLQNIAIKENMIIEHKNLTRNKL